MSNNIFSIKKLASLSKWLIIFFVIIQFQLSCAPAVVTTAICGSAFKLARDISMGEVIDDLTISTKIRKEFLRRGLKKLYLRINTEVVQGRVLYTGTVKDDEDIVTAVDIAWQQAGVKEVVNELQIDKEGYKFSTQKYLKDTWITSQIKTKIFVDRSIKFSNYTIVTSDNVVYVFGISRSEEELNKVLDISSRVLGVEKVVNHTKNREF